MPAEAVDGTGSRQHIGVTLSGGGHRATLFGLGALAYLIDAGKGREVSTISSISGGSITNGWIGLNADITQIDPGKVDGLIRPLANQIARHGTLWASKLTYLFLASLVGIILAAGVLTYFLGAPISWVIWPIAIALVAWLAQKRSWVARHAFESTLFQGRPLTDLHRNVTHVIGATDIQTSEQVYFSSEFVYAWRTGVGQPADLHVADAVQASAALPGAFTPVSIPLGPHRFPKSPGLKSFLLDDGGVYDNMGSEWLIRASEGFDDDAGGDHVHLHDVDEVVIVNSSAARSIIKRGLAHVPGLGEVVSLLAVKDVMYDQTTALRRRWLDTRYRIAQRAADRLPGLALRGATIQIDRSPYDLPEIYEKFDDEQGKAAKLVIKHLDAAGDRAYWKAEAEANRKVKTTLSKIDPDRAAGLLRHAYVLTMANCHVLLGYPLLDVPTRERAKGWVTLTNPGT